MRQLHIVDTDGRREEQKIRRRRRWREEQLKHGNAAIVARPKAVIEVVGPTSRGWDVRGTQSNPIKLAKMTNCPTSA